MTNTYHAAVWIDHREAKVFHIAKDSADQDHVHAHNAPGNIHHKAGTTGSGHAHEDKHFLKSIVESLKSAQEILIMGHGEAKTALAHYIRDHEHDLAKRVVGVETLDNPTDPQIVAFAHAFFKRKDRTTPLVLSH